jgi:hypothetical protein
MVPFVQVDYTYFNSEISVEKDLFFDILSYTENQFNLDRLFDFSIEKSIFKLNPRSNTVPVIGSHKNESKNLIYFILMFSRQKINHQITLFSIDDFIGIVGGYFQIFFIIFNFLGSCYNERKYDIYLTKKMHNFFYQKNNLLVLKLHNNTNT